MEGGNGVRQRRTELRIRRNGEQNAGSIKTSREVRKVREVLKKQGELGCVSPRKISRGAAEMRRKFAKL